MKKIIITIIISIIFIFVIDFVCIFCINRPLFAIKEDNSDSVNIIYKGIFYDVYNCIEYSAPQIKLKGVKFNCTIDIKDTSKLKVKGVTMTIKKGTLTKTGATIIITDINKHKYEYGQFFRIDVKENNSWKELEKIGDATFNLMAYSVDENNQLEFKHNWKNIYGKLQSGEYRLVKEVCINEFCKDKKEFSVEFIIK